MSGREGERIEEIKGVAGGRTVTKVERMRSRYLEISSAGQFQTVRVVGFVYFEK